MRGRGGFMRIRMRYGWLLLALVSVGFLVFYKYRESDGYISVDSGNSELQIRGRQFRAEVESQYMAMAKADARRTYILNDVCNKYFPAGTPFSDVEAILVSAGARSGKEGDSVLVPDYNHSLPPSSPDRNDLGGGFLLDKSLMSNSMFIVIFRPQDSGAIPKRIGEIIGCFVRSTNL